MGHENRWEQWIAFVFRYLHHESALRRRPSNHLLCGHVAVLGTRPLSVRFKTANKRAPGASWFAHLPATPAPGRRRQIDFRRKATISAARLIESGRSKANLRIGRRHRLHGHGL